MTQQRNWKKERELRESIYEALIAEAQPARRLFSARDFVRGQVRSNRKALVQFLKLPDESALWSAMDSPSFLTPGVIQRLCLWGWNPYQERTSRRSRLD